MAFMPRPQEIYKHFKGNLYQVVAIAQHSETGEQLVVYQALYGDFKTYARPLDMFVSRVDRGKYPDVGQEFCFELQGPDSARQVRESEPDEAAAAIPEAAPAVPEGSEAGAATDAGAAAAAPAGTDAAPAAPEGSEAGASAAAVADAPAAAPEAAAEEEVELDPLLLEFLDADTYEERLNILAGLHHRITDDMITTMAIVCDIEVNEGDVEERYEALKNCLLTLERYECNRLR